MLLIGMLFAAALTQAPAWADQDMPAPQDRGITVTGEKKKYDPNKRVCKGSTPTGSVVRKLTCRTAGEWKIEAERSAVALELRRKEQASRENTRLAREYKPSR